MTAATTILGLTPLAVGDTQVGSGGPAYYPTRAIIGGLAFSTLVSLFVVPMVYIGLDKLNGQRDLECLWGTTDADCRINAFEIDQTSLPSTYPGEEKCSDTTSDAVTPSTAPSSTSKGSGMTDFSVA